MDRKEICELLVELEKTATEQFFVDGINVWPLIRSLIIVQLNNFTAFEKKEEQIQKISDPKFTKIISSFEEEIKEQTQKVYIEQYKDDTDKFDSEIIFLTPSNTLTVLPNSDRFFDRVTDPFLHIAKKMCVASKFYTNRAIITDYSQCYFPSTLVENTAVKENHIKIPEEFKGQFEILLQNTPVDSNKLYEALLVQWINFLRGMINAENLCRNYKKLKIVGIVAWIASVFNQGTITGLRKNNITVLEIPHGLCGEYMAFNTHWTNIPKEGYPMMPDKFLYWGEAEYNYAHKWFKNSLHETMIVGNPWPDYYDKYFRKYSTTYGKKKKAKKVILVTLDAAITEDSPHIVPAFLLEFMKDSKNSGYYILFRPHPNAANSLVHLKESLHGIPTKCYKIVTNETLYENFDEATHHVTAYSTCTFEASFFGIPTFCFGKNSKLLYRDEISRGEVTWSEGNGKLSDFERWLAKEEYIINKESSQFISSLEYTENVLRDIFSKQKLI